MNFVGVTDSFATLLANPNECPNCHATSRIAQGLCLSCLLQSGFDDDDDADGTAEFTAALDSIAVTDTHWRLGNYEILEEIGRGGMGVIYRARQRHSRRIVALKRILGYHADSRETLARFRREAEAAASLDHPNILPIYEVAESDEGVPYFSMKFAPGGSLQEVGPALRDDPRAVVSLMAKVTRAVQSAHRQGILHRDLKPGNILLDARGEPLVSDFGLAKWLDTSSDLTRTLTIFGTPGYVAPEQAAGDAARVKPAADVYSLGAILFDLLAGRPPFLGEHALAVIHQAAEQSAPKLRSLVKSANRDLETICARCLERDPAARYPSAGDLAEDLERWLEGRSIIARPVSPPARLWRWSRRKPELATATLACLALAAAAAIWQIEGRRLQTSLRKNQLATHSVAVLPFLDLDRAQAAESVAGALAGRLQADLGRVVPVRIEAMRRGSSLWAGTGSVDDINEANRILRARTVLTGSKRIVNGKVRFSVRLMSGATGEMLFAKSFETSSGPSSVTALEEIIAPAIRRTLDATNLSTIAPSARDPGLRNPTAREFIISGRQLMFRDTIEDYDRSIRCLLRAIQIEPKSAIAYAYLSSTEASRTFFIHDPNLLNRAEEHARQALQLEPDSPEGHRDLAGVFFQKDNLHDALEEQLRAMEVGGPEERVAKFRGVTLMGLGRPDQALPWLVMGNHWASLPGSCDALIGDCWSLLGDDPRAEAAYRRARDLRPENPDGWLGLCHLRLLRGEFDAARNVYQQNRDRTIEAETLNTTISPTEMLAQTEFFARNYSVAEQLYAELAKSRPAARITPYGAMSCGSALGQLRQVSGDVAAARSILQERLASETPRMRASDNPSHLYLVAAIESSLGHVDLALRHLRAAMAAGWIDYRSLRLDPRFDAIASDHRFHEIISAMTVQVAELRRRAGQPIIVAENGEKPSP